MVVHGVRYFAAVLVLTAACGGRVIIDGADDTASVAGSSAVGVALGGAGSGAAGEDNATAGAPQGGGGTAGAAGGADAGGVVDCPAPPNYFQLSTIDGAWCSSVGAFCSPGGCTFNCSCEAAGDSPRWNCVPLGCIK